MELNLAKPSSSPYLPLLVPKSDSKYRFCTDYRQVNVVIVSDFFPLSRIDDCIGNVGSSNLASNLDFTKGLLACSTNSLSFETSAFVRLGHFLQYIVKLQLLFRDWSVQFWLTLLIAVRLLAAETAVGSILISNFLNSG